MSNVTLATLWQRVAEEVGGYFSFTTSSAGDTGATTAVGAALMEFADGALKEKWIQNSTGTIEVRKIQDNFSPTGTALVYRPFSSQIGTSIGMEVFDFSPADIIKFINHSIRDSYPHLAKEVYDTTLIGKNVLLNSNFEEWTLTTVPDSWTVSVSTVVQETTIKLFGSSSMELNTAAGSCYISSDTVPELRQFENGSATFKCWVNSSAATSARIYIYTITADGTAATTYSTVGGTSGYHTGGGEWELLETASVSVPDNLAEIRFGCIIGTVDTAYFDNAHCAGSVTDYKLPSTVENVLQVNQCNDCDEFVVDEHERIDFDLIDKSGTKYLRMDIDADKKIEIVGFAPYTALSTSSSTIDLSTDWQRAIVCGATASLLRSNAVTISSNNISEVLKLADKYTGEFEMLKRLNSKNLSRKYKKWGS